MENIIDIPSNNNICYRVTRRCNMACPFCQAPPNKMEFSFEEHLNAIRLLRDSGIKKIKFTGGEPYVYKRFNDLIEYASSIGLEVTVCTNLTRLTDHDLDVLKDNSCKIKASLHGVNGVHNYFTQSNTEETVCTNIEKSSSRGIHTSIHTILSERNIGSLDDLFEFAVEKGVRKVSVIPMIRRGLAINTTDYLPEELTRQIHREFAERYGSQLKVSYLDFRNKKYFVVETDGCLYAEIDGEHQDERLYDLRELIRITA